MEKFPEADQLIQPLDTGAKNSYLGRGEPTTGDSHNQAPSAPDQGTCRALGQSTLCALHQTPYPALERQRVWSHRIDAEEFYALLDTTPKSSTINSESGRTTTTTIAPTVASTARHPTYDYARKPRPDRNRWTSVTLSARRRSEAIFVL